ncbi:MAG: TraR/DksA C4-type zinc finger protein [Proteobacteria bacterium]|nr:TraR/DksA C4-type zinc finger protein [Pseudomonadota bacterium]
MRTSEARDRLLARRHELLARYQDGRERVDQELAEHDPEVVERATEQWDASVVSKLGDADLAILGDVVTALTRIEAGTYGICTMCEEPISERRLVVLPEAATCVSCAGLVARTHSQGG